MTDTSTGSMPIAGELGDIDGFLDRARHGLSHLIHLDPDKETPQVTAPAGSPIDHLNSIAADLQANPLVASLLASGLGRLLHARDVDTITALVDSLEQPHRQTVLTADGPVNVARAQAGFPPAPAQPVTG